MKSAILFLSVLFVVAGVRSQTAYEQQTLCKNLKEVFESGIRENFESITGTNARQSPFLPVPGYSIKLPDYPVIYVDKDSRFVGKHNQNLDSLTALIRLEELKEKISFCLDTSIWHWNTLLGDDSTTVFFKETFQHKAVSSQLNLWLAVVNVAPKIYSVNLYIKRRR
jgi:hypothetical protein